MMGERWRFHAIRGRKKNPMSDIRLLPRPRSWAIYHDRPPFVFGPGDGILLPALERASLYEIAERLRDAAKEQARASLRILIERQGKHRAAFRFERDPNVRHEEAYAIDVDAEGVRVRFGGAAGAFHAVSTLKQLLIQCGKELPAQRIEDVPDFPARGIMLDISRDKIPTMASLYAVVDFMADFKLNELQLYIEGFSFAYPSYPEVWRDGTPITGEEIVELDRYCRSKHIRLVPNQNSFGHMEAWLARDEFRDMAECPEGYAASWPPGHWQRADTLDPTNPRSLPFVERLTDDLLPYFASELFNIGCDETELGRGKSAEVCERRGKGEVYVDYVLGVYEIARSRGKRAMFWGDIIMKSPELIERLPKDLIALEWGYEADHPFEADGRKFKEAGLDFYVCPGTSSWCSIAGRTDNMLGNMKNAAVNGRRNGAIGFLMTDWGDNGHWQYPLFSAPGFAYGAAVSWSADANADAENDLAVALDRFVFRDRSERMGELLLALGNYYRVEKHRRTNGTIAATMLYAKLEDMSFTEDCVPEDFERLKSHVRALLERLGGIRLNHPEADIFEAEIRNAVALIAHAGDLGKLKLLVKHGANFADPDHRAFLKRMIEDMTGIIREHENLWLLRNRHGGLASSAGKLVKLKEAYEGLLRSAGV